MYLSQKGCARKSRPTEVAARSKSLVDRVSGDELQERGGEVEGGGGV